jgi:hypothetical protein
MAPVLILLYDGGRPIVLKYTVSDSNETTVIKVQSTLEKMPEGTVLDDYGVDRDHGNDARTLCEIKSIQFNTVNIDK